jgi:hypothetical protein
MKHLFILLITITTGIHMQAQNVWKDYVIGRPMAGYFEAKKITAEEWGINYEAIFAGCILTDEVDTLYKKYKAENEKYFQTLASKFGKDWQRYFNLDVQKKANLTHSRDTAVWIEPVMGKPYIQHFNAKEIVAKKWGINYEPRFLGCVVDDTKTAEMETILLGSNAYISRLTARFGEKWEKEFNREVKLEVAKINAPITPIPDATNTKDIWVDAIIGKPNASYFNAKKAIAKEWGIQYVTNFMGCKRSAKMMKLKKINIENEKYFVKLTKQYGEDWILHFNREVQKKIAATSL